VINGIAYHVNKNIVQDIDHVSVNLGVSVIGNEVDTLAAFATEIPSYALHLLEDASQWHHAHGHAQVLQLTHNLPCLRNFAQQIVAAFFQEMLILGYHGLGNHQFPNHINEFVQAGGINANGCFYLTFSLWNDLLLGRILRIADICGCRRCLLQGRFLSDRFAFHGRLREQLRLFAAYRQFRG
jgi:hypothetical protein